MRPFWKLDLTLNSSGRASGRFARASLGDDGGGLHGFGDGLGVDVAFMVGALRRDRTRG